MAGAGAGVDTPLSVEYTVAIIVGAVINFYVCYAVAHILQWAVGFTSKPRLSLLQNQLRFLTLFVAVVLSKYAVKRLLMRVPILLSRPQWQTPQLGDNFFSGWAYDIVLGPEMTSFFLT